MKSVHETTLWQPQIIASQPQTCVNKLKREHSEVWSTIEGTSIDVSRPSLVTVYSLYQSVEQSNFEMETHIVSAFTNVMTQIAQMRNFVGILFHLTEFISIYRNCRALTSVNKCKTILCKYLYCLFTNLFCLLSMLFTEMFIFSMV